MVLIYFGYGPTVFLFIKMDEPWQEKKSQSMSNLSTDIFFYKILLWGEKYYLCYFIVSKSVTSNKFFS